MRHAVGFCIHEVGVHRHDGGAVIRADFLHIVIDLTTTIGIELCPPLDQQALETLVLPACVIPWNA